MVHAAIRSRAATTELSPGLPGGGQSIAKASDKASLAMLCLTILFNAFDKNSGPVHVTAACPETEADNIGGPVISMDFFNKYKFFLYQ